ncbi:MAG: DUF4426 domain-containing protein [Gammaproteobacteria bacterium]|nr:DUF4426 domain-containing protein [Gammaproteobacteria bacterium]
MTKFRPPRWFFWPFMVISVCQFATAEQSVELAGYEVHYSVIRSTFLQPQVAERHDIVRAKNRAVITISALHDDSKPPPDRITGTVTNLLSQQTPLEFKLVEEGSARYYLATFLFTSEEPLTFKVQLHLSDESHEFSFKQPVYDQ